MNPLEPFITRFGALVVDGGLATELEGRGCDLNDPMWSARYLLEAPDLIRQVHSDYYWAGADCCISASYQATIPGFMRWGLSADRAAELLCQSVTLVKEARDTFWHDFGPKSTRLRPLVAASVGPYGAYLADGSEYTGAYELSEAELIDFHADRWAMLAGSGPDLMACETIPSFAEARALASILEAVPDVYAWFSFSCRDGEHISDGTPLAECATFLDKFEHVAAIGINCTPPRFIPDLIRSVTAVTHKPVVVYPNSGEAYDPVAKQWVGQSVPSEFGSYSREWRKLGANVIGGCCRTTPAHIRQIRDRFREK